MSDNSTPDSSLTANPNLELTPGNPFALSWTQIRSILKHGAEQTQIAMNSAISDQSETADQLLSCSICLEPYHCVNIEGQIEKPALAACGHIFGDICIERWLALPMNHLGPTCPVCRFPLKFSSCRHAIKAVDPYDTVNGPPPVLNRNDKDFPLSCSECSIRRLPSQQKYQTLEDHQTEYNHILTNLEATITKVQDTGAKDVLQRGLKSKAQYIKAVKDLEQGKLELKEKIEEEKDTFLQSLKAKCVWHLKVDNTKWPVPAGERPHDAYEFHGEDAEDGEGEDYDDEDEDEHYEDDEDAISDVEDLADRISEDLSADGDANEDAESERSIE